MAKKNGPAFHRSAFFGENFIQEAEQGFFLTAQGLHGLQGFLAAHGLQGFFFLAAHGLHGLQGCCGQQGFLAAHGLHFEQPAAAS